ncbi:uncharacterized protein [Panulirus ornatus]
MYATFEEFIDNQQTSGDGSPASRPSSAANSATEAPPPPAPNGGLGASSPRDVVSSLAAAAVTSSSGTTTRAHMAQVALPSSHAPRPHSPPVARDDLALASPRRRRRPRRLRRSVDNPLLDTISTIGDADSDEADLLPPAPPPSASSCWGPRLHPDADVVGYAGSNSVDSGYKSACPTPELPDPAAYLEHRLEKRGSLASLASTGSSSGSGSASKPRIAMGTRVMSRVPRSPSAGGSAPSPGLPRRPGSDGSYYELDQLAGLRGGLLGSPPPHTAPAEVRNPGFTRYSPRGSPAPHRNSSPGGAAPRDTHVSRRAASPASPERRPRSASTGSRCSPGTRGRRPPGGLRAGSPLLASTGSLPRASSPGRRSRALSPATREDSRPPTSWSRHSSPGVAPPPRSLRRPPSPIVGGHHDTDLALLEREIDALLYGDPLAPPPAPDYYDLDSEFAACTCPAAFSRPTPPGTMAGLMVCCSASDGVGGSSAPLCPPGCAPRVRRPQCAGVVGRCVLAALDDLHYRHSAARRPSRDALSPSSEAPEALLRSSRLPLHDLRPHKHPDDTTSESSYDSASDYHLYEEILYEATASPRPPEAIPPPLPARPPHLFRSVLVQHPQEPQQTQQQQQQPRLQQPLPPQRRHPPEVQTTQQPQHKQTVPHVQTLTKPTDSPQTSPPAQPQSPPQPHQCRTKPTPPPKPPKPQRAVPTPEGKPVTPLKHPLTPPTTSLTNSTTNLTTSLPKVGSQTAGVAAPPAPPPPQQQQQQQDQQQQQQQGGTVPLKPTINKPKQRSNLYSIFRDRDHRRCLSASLQQEYQKDFQQEFLPDQNPAGAAAAVANATTTATTAASCASLAGAEDDYGFKVVPHVV